MWEPYLLINYWWRNRAVVYETFCHLLKRAFLLSRGSFLQRLLRFAGQRVWGDVVRISAHELLTVTRAWKFIWTQSVFFLCLLNNFLFVMASDGIEVHGTYSALLVLGEGRLEPWNVDFTLLVLCVITGDNLAFESAIFSFLSTLLVELCLAWRVVNLVGVAYACGLN